MNNYIEIPYLTEEEIEVQKNIILDAGMKKREPMSGKLKEIFLGPGLQVIFYRSKLILLGSLFIYLFIAYLCVYLGNFVLHEEYLSILSFPMLYLIFHMLSYWSEDQDSIIELKSSLHYSFQYMVSLRMFYVSILSAFINLIFVGSFTSYQYIGKVSMIGLSSLFLFAFFMLFLCEKMHGLRSIMCITGIWFFFCIVLSVYGEKISIIVFEVIPFIVHILMFLFCFGLFIYYFGKVGNKYAYACEY